MYVTLLCDLTESFCLDWLYFTLPRVICEIHRHHIMHVFREAN